MPYILSFSGTVCTFVGFEMMTQYSTCLSPLKSAALWRNNALHLVRILCITLPMLLLLCFFASFIGLEFSNIDLIPHTDIRGGSERSPPMKLRRRDGEAVGSPLFRL